jgi:hypothetical protein
MHLTNNLRFHDQITTIKQFSGQPSNYDISTQGRICFCFFFFFARFPFYHFAFVLAVDHDLDDYLH